MLVEFLKAISTKDGSQVYFVLTGTVIGGEIVKVDYDLEFIQLKAATFPHGLAVPIFIIPFGSIQAWGARPRG